MKFYNPLGFLILGIIPVIIILHFFKSKNVRYEVSSLYLWQKADLNSREDKTSRKLNEIIRLIIQILAAAAAAFACARPYIPTDAGKYTIIADCSMSMENKSDEMKKKICGFVNGLDKNSEMVLIGADDDPHILMQGSDKKSVTDEVNRIETGIKSIDYSKLESIALNTKGECWFFSDLNDKDIPESWNTVKIGKDENNIAVTYLSADNESVLARISNFSDKDADTKASIYIDDKMKECREISIAAESSENIVFNGISTGNVIKCTVNDDSGIYSDNSRRTERLYKKVQICCDNIFIEKAVSAVGNISIDKSDTPAAGYDVYIFDGSIPENLPDGDIMLFNAQKGNGIADIGEDTPVNNIKAEDFSFFESGDMEICIEKARKISGEGYRTILSGDETDLIIEKSIGERKCVLTSFDLHNSDFVLYKEFPMFIQSCFDMFRGGGNIENPDISESNLKSVNSENGSAAVSRTNINRSMQALFAVIFIVLVFADMLKRGERYGH